METFTYGKSACRFLITSPIDEVGRIPWPRSSVGPFSFAVLSSDWWAAPDCGLTILLDTGWNFGSFRS
jgi:hypothetical protein